MDDFVLGDRELDVMGVLWDLGSGTVSEVRRKLPADLAYTTVLIQAGPGQFSAERLPLQHADSRATNVQRAG